MPQKYQKRTHMPGGKYHPNVQHCQLASQNEPTRNTAPPSYCAQPDSRFLERLRNQFPAANRFAVGWPTGPANTAQRIDAEDAGWPPG
jgi:hypothetical protein